MAQYLPCLNTNCKSYGKPHPNCLCYSSFGEEGAGGAPRASHIPISKSTASQVVPNGPPVGHGNVYGPHNTFGPAFSKGGQVSFCSGNRAHNHDCEYYAGGGEIPASEVKIDEPNIPANEVKLDASPEIPNDEVNVDAKPDDGGYLEQTKAAAEGASQGLLGPLAPMIETGLGISTKEAIARRAEDFPVTHGVSEGLTFAGSLLIPVAAGVTAAGVAARGANAISKAARLGKVGSAVLKGAVESASFAASDEMTKAFLGQPGSDPEHPVSSALLNVGAAGLMGGLTGGAFTLGSGIIGKEVDKIGSDKVLSKVEQFLIKLGESKDPLGDIGVTKKISSTISKGISAEASIKTGSGPLGYDVIQKLITPHIEKITNKVVSKANPYVTDAAIKAIMTNEASGMMNAVHYATEAGRGAQKAAEGLGALFKAGSTQVAPAVTDFAREQLKEFIEGGQVDKQLQNSMQEPENQQNFAEGGEVRPEPNRAFARIFPEQNTILNTAKGRISGYLNGMRPLTNQPKKAFDSEPSNKDQHRQYNKAIDLAINPLSIIDQVNQGNLSPDSLKHFVSLYPEVHRYLSKEMTKEITKAQLSGKKPPYNKRQSMSLFLGTDLDSTFSPAAVQTIQALYANKQQPQPSPGKNKKGTSTLTKASNSYLTDEQSREKRMQNQK